jgi:hypothetical protein
VHGGKKYKIFRREQNRVENKYFNFDAFARFHKAYRELIQTQIMADCARIVKNTL